jgi:membrane protease YdiL (CAAX protease family)
MGDASAPRVALAPRRDDPTAGIRRISIRRYLGIEVGYLAVLLLAELVSWMAFGGGGSTAAGGTAGSATYTETGAIWARTVVPVGASLVFVVVVVTRLGWWRPVLHDHKPVRRWVWVVPGVLALTALAATNYPGLAETSAAFVASLLLGTMLIGLTEELMSRGVGVTAFRVNGYGERAVALWTSLIFGLSHAASLLGGPVGLIQVAYTTVGGVLFYLTRRVTGGLVGAVLIHGLWDFGLFSAAVVPGETYGVVPVFFLPHLVLVVVLLLGRNRIGATSRPATA